MADQYAWELILATVVSLVAAYNLGLFALYNLVMNRSCKRTDFLEAGSASAINGECGSQTNDDFDIIIVGAGVAGAALAHTLGKVIFISCLSCFLHFFCRNG